MATKARYTRLLVNEFDFSGVSNSLEVALNVAREDATCFQDTGAVTVPTDTSGTISQQGYFVDAAAGEFEQEIEESLSNTESLYVAALFGTDVAACPAYVARATNTNNLTISAAVPGLITVSGEWYQGTGILRGLRVWTGTFDDVEAQATPAYIDLGAAGSAGGYAWLWVQAIDGTATNADIVLQSDSATGFGTAATEATFTFSAVGGYEQALSGTVNRYLRLSCTDLGGATSFTVVCVAAVSGITY